MTDSRTPRIVVIDDDDTVSDAIQLLMQLRGWEAKRYRSCEDFIDQFDQEEPPACMILDLYFKGMSGVELQQYLAEQGVQIPTIVLTAWPDKALSRQAVEAGAIEVFTKPVSSDRLLQAVESVISSSSESPVKIK